MLCESPYACALAVAQYVGHYCTFTESTWSSDEDALRDEDKVRHSLVGVDGRAHPGSIGHAHIFPVARPVAWRTPTQSSVTGSHCTVPSKPLGNTELKYMNTENVWNILLQISQFCTSR